MPELIDPVYVSNRASFTHPGMSVMVVSLGRQYHTTYYDHSSSGARIVNFVPTFWTLSGGNERTNFGSRRGRKVQSLARGSATPIYIPAFYIHTPGTSRLNYNMPPESPQLKGPRNIDIKLLPLRRNPPHTTPHFVFSNNAAFIPDGATPNRP